MATQSLHTLIKLQKTKVDDQRQLLARLHEQLEIILNDLETLKIEQAMQQAILHDNPEMSITYSEYLKQCLKKEALLNRKKRTAEQAVDIAHERLAELFEEQKRYEIAQRQREEEEAREEAVRETKTLDEVGSISFIRKHKKK